MSDTAVNGKKPNQLPVVCTPVVLFTQEDAEKIASFTPAKYLGGHSNILLIGAMANPETLPELGKMIVAHHVQSLKTNKTKVVNVWEIGVPLVPIDIPGGSKHIFRVHLEHLLPPSALKAPSEGAPGTAAPEPTDGRSKNVEVPKDVPVSSPRAS